MRVRKQSVDLPDQQSGRYVELLEAFYTSALPPTSLNWQRFEAQMEQGISQSNGKVSSQEKIRRFFRSPWLQGWRKSQIKDIFPTLIHPVSNRRRMPMKSRLLLVGLGLCLFIVLVGATNIVYAVGEVSGVFQALFSPYPARQTLYVKHQITQLGQSIEADGRKVTLEGGYADANQVLLSLSVTLPHPPTANEKPNYWYLSNAAENFSLETDHHVALKFIEQRSGVNKQGDTAGFLDAYDAAAIQGNPDHLLLHLKMPVNCSDGLYQCAHSIEFTFTLPFHAGRVLTPHQTMSRNGKNLTLEKVVIAPSETRLYIRGFSMDDSVPPMQLWGKLKTFTSKHFSVEMAHGKKKYRVCTVQDDMCGQEEVIAPELVQQLYEFRVPGGAVVAGAGGGDERIYLGNDQTIIGLPMTEDFTKERGDWNVTVTQWSTQLILEMDHGQPSYSEEGPYTPDLYATPWVFKIHIP